MQRINLDRPKLPRNREVKACLECRNSKLKCDRSKPSCQRCRANNRSCNYAVKVTKAPEPTAALERKVAPGTSAETASKSLIDNYPNDQTLRLNQAGLLKATEDSELRYYSSSSWISSLEDPPEPSIAFPSNTSPPSDSTPYISPPTSDAESELSIYDFASVTEVHKVVCYFAEYAQFFFPVVDIQTVTSALHRHSKTKSTIPPEISALVAAMCFAASSTLIMSGQADASDTEPTFWKDLAHRFLFASGYPIRPNLNSLRAAFLLGASSMTEWNFLPDPTPISVLIRTAQTLGLHRDPASLGCSPREADYRRRLWWSISTLDISYALAHAVPPMINQDHSDVQVIDDSNTPELRWLTFIIGMILTVSKILEDIYGIRKPNTHILQRLDAEIVSRNKPPSRKSHSESAQDKFIARCRRMCCDKMMYILHQPYLRSGSWPRESRNKALESAVEFIRDYSFTITEPSLAQYRWILSHWSMFHPLAIILQDFIQYPHSSEAVTLRELVASTFVQFSNPADHNWKRLHSLRERAWRANGWLDGDTSRSERLSVDASLDDWNPLFASFLWDFTSPTTSNSTVP